MIRIMYQENGEQKDVTGKVIVGNAQGIELEENNMKDGNKTVVELIADLQNQLDRANNRIEGLVKKNDELKEINNTQFKNLHDLRLEYNGLYNKFHALDIEHSALIGKYCDYDYNAVQSIVNEKMMAKSMEEIRNKNRNMILNLAETIVDDAFSLPYFRAYTRYHNMMLYARYTLEELGL